MNQYQPIAQAGYQEALAYLCSLLPRPMGEQIELLERAEQHLGFWEVVRRHCPAFFQRHNPDIYLTLHTPLPDSIYEKLAGPLSEALYRYARVDSDRLYEQLMEEGAQALMVWPYPIGVGWIAHEFWNSGELPDVPALSLPVFLFLLGERVERDLWEYCQETFGWPVEYPHLCSLHHSAVNVFHVNRFAAKSRAIGLPGAADCLQMLWQMTDNPFLNVNPYEWQDTDRPINIETLEAMRELAEAAEAVDGRAEATNAAILEHPERLRDVLRIFAECLELTLPFPIDLLISPNPFHSIDGDN